MSTRGGKASRGACTIFLILSLVHLVQATALPVPLEEKEEPHPAPRRISNLIPAPGGTKLLYVFDLTPVLIPPAGRGVNAGVSNEGRGSKEDEEMIVSSLGTVSNVFARRGEGLEAGDTTRPEAGQAVAAEGGKTEE